MARGDRDGLYCSIRRMCQVVLIRPGATIYDEQNRVQGILDIPLSERGQGEVARMAQKLARSLDGSPPRGALLRSGRERDPDRGDRRQGRWASAPSGSTSSATSTRDCGKGCRSTKSSAATPSCFGSGSTTRRRSVRRRARRSKARWDESRRRSGRCSSAITTRRSAWSSVSPWPGWSPAT